MSVMCGFARDLLLWGAQVAVALSHSPQMRWMLCVHQVVQLLAEEPFALTTARPDDVSVTLVQRDTVRHAGVR